MRMFTQLNGDKMEIIKLFHPILGKNIYQPKEQTDMQSILKELYDYQQLDKDCKELTDMNLFQFLKGSRKTAIIESEEVEVDDNTDV